ncbi:fibronectin type III domain-containing protein [Balneolales bacterium ANBcel1]|nr:fibronectin type III domain-containing protein [Balneolales bacterium ANBcel1]
MKRSSPSPESPMRMQIAGCSRYLAAAGILLLLLQSCRTPEPVIPPEPEIDDPRTEEVHAAVRLLIEELYETKEPVLLPTAVFADSISLYDKEMTLNVYMNDRFSYVPWREADTQALYRIFSRLLPDRYRDYRIRILTLGEPVESLIPNYFRESPEHYDFQRMPYADKLRPRPVVHREGRHLIPRHGLEGRQIALWHSHGWHYNQQMERWEWQRPRLFQTVEDLLPMAFTLPYLIPMLENAGAYVWSPRERDTQTNEVIVDFDGSSGNSRVDIEGDWQYATPGFAIGSPPYGDGENPFRQGRYFYTGENGTATMTWIPDIPEAGEYAVYISFASRPVSSDRARYTVYHRGGQTEFTVNQAIGGGTWIYLGHFEFEEGVNPGKGQVVLTGPADDDADAGRRARVITADAVRFGGGMGSVARDGEVSGRARYLEAARYYMQYAGMPDSLVYGTTGGRSDVVDDFRGRGEWVNYLMGAPFGPNAARETRGLGIPIDLSLAFHTDAGITRNDTVVGTLMIYSIEDGDSLREYPDKISRLANRDYADILQTGIVEELRRSWDPAWNRRHLFNRMYSEAVRPNTPAALLELLSHQNFLDMQFAQDPRFRFDVSRAIYISMLRYLSHRYQLDYVVQPLPVSHFRIKPLGGSDLELRWNPVRDSLEATAIPDRYIVYKKRGDEPFDAGRITTEASYQFTGLEPGVMYRFKVVAANEGGKSFPSETLSAMVSGELRRPVLIVNGFERVSGPAIVDEPGFSGFANFLDSGVPDRYDIHFTGEQYDFDPESEWRTNDAPGHGASHADYETRIIAGNSFDYPAVYGASLRELGVPFVSASAASVRSRQVDPADFDVVILILGNQKSTPWPKQDKLGREPEFPVFPQRMREELERYLALGGRLFISGAHVGTDVGNRASDDPDGVRFIRETLRFQEVTSHAARTGTVRPAGDRLWPSGFRLTFNTQYDSRFYRVDAPDALEPYGEPMPVETEVPKPVREADPSSNGERGQVTMPDAGQTVSPSGDGARQSVSVSVGGIVDAAQDRVTRPDAEPGRDRLGPSFRTKMIPSGPETLIRYDDNGFSAGVGFRSAHSGAVTFGFPFESIMDPSERTEVLGGVLHYLGLDLEAAPGAQNGSDSGGTGQ